MLAGTYVRFRDEQADGQIGLCQDLDGHRIALDAAARGNGHGPVLIEPDLSIGAGRQRRALYAQSDVRAANRERARAVRVVESNPHSIAANRHASDHPHRRVGYGRHAEPVLRRTPRRDPVIRGLLLRGRASIVGADLKVGPYQKDNERKEDARAADHRPGVFGFSTGAPVPDDPRNSLRPSAKVMSRPFPRLDPSFARNPSTTISAPTGSDSLVKPRRYNAFGGPPSIIQRSTVPSAFFTSR